MHRITLMRDRSEGAAAVLLVVAPIVVGALAGLLVAESKAGYVIVSVVAAIGAVLAGMEHVSVVDGAYRGLLMGLLYGTALLTVLELREKAPKVDLPDHLIVQVIITAVVSVILASIGAALQARHRRRARASRSTPSSSARSDRSE